MNVVSRAELDWSALGITRKRHDAFGWKIDQHVMPIGSKLVTTSSVEVPRDRAPNRALYVRGLASCIHENGSALSDRVPGLYTQDHPPMPAGCVTTTAEEETEFWCFNYTVNRKTLPELKPIVLAAGETYDFKAGDKVFALLGRCGDLFGPASFAPQADMTITAASPFYAFVIAEAKP